MEEADITIVGAGIIGLALSASVSRENRSVYVLEKNDSFGRETSSRNSEVVHAGMYYPKDSLKAKTCVEGNRLIYEICKKNDINYKKTGKLITANEQVELKEIQRLLHNGEDNGVSGLKILNEQEIKHLEPNVTALAALSSPDTGIVDSHNLMRYFLQTARAQGAEFIFHSEAKAIQKQKRGYQVNIHDADGSNFSFLTHILINCAGLNSDIVAKKAGIDIEGADYILKFCKGEYFRLKSGKARLIKHLIYSLPDKKEISLGIHATPDLGGGLRLGPDAEYIERDRANYNIDNSKREHFANAVNRFLPFVEAKDLIADTAGIRPKLQGPENGFRDFVVQHEEERGFPGLINLIGIDSPGLTSAPAIARYVQDMVERLI